MFVLETVIDREVFSWYNIHNTLIHTNMCFGYII